MQPIDKYDPRKQKQKTMVSPFYALSGNITTPNVSRTPSFHRVSSAPDLITPKAELLHEKSIKHLNISDELQTLKPSLKRIMTVPTNLSDYHHPFIVLELLLNLPMECHMGITDNLKPMIDKAIIEQTKLQKQQNVIIQQQINRIQQTKQQIKLYQDKIAENTPSPFFDTPSPADVPSAPSATAPSAAPSAIPPTAICISNHNEYTALKHDGHSRRSARNKASIKEFESVLQEGYTFHLMMAVLQALVGAFLSGYNTSLLNVPSSIIRSQCDLNQNMYSSLQSFYCLGGLIGALSIGKIADKFGRKCAIIMFDILFIISGLLTFGYAQNMFIIFAVGRFLCGVGAGIATAIIPIYLGEISPPLIRGTIGTLTQLTISAGLLVAEILAYHQIFGTATLWTFLFVLNIILPVLQICTLWTLPESPKWLITKNDETEARKVLQYLRQCSNVDIHLHFTKLILSQQKKTRESDYGSITSVPHTSESTAKWKNNKMLLWAITIAIGLQILQQFSGINSIFYYSNSTLINAGFTGVNELWIGNVAIAAANCVSVLIPVYLMDKWGRKTLLNISLCGMILACVGFSICNGIKGSDHGYMSVVFLIFYVISFEIGLGPIPWLMMAEITPSSHRAVIVSIATFSNWASNLLIAQFANKLIQYSQFFAFAVICFVGLIVTNKFIPETKNKTEMQIQQELLNKL